MAAALYKVALDGLREAKGARHPERALVAGNLGVLLHERGDLAEARTPGHH